MEICSNGKESQRKEPTVCKIPRAQRVGHTELLIHSLLRNSDRVRHPPITAMAFVLTMGDVSRFPRGKQVASYLGLIPREYSSGGHQGLGSISKQGSSFLRMLLVEAAQIAVRCDAGFRKEYLHRCHTKAKGVAKVAAARKLAIRLYWMLRTMTKYPEIVRIESSSRVALGGAS